MRPTPAPVPDPQPPPPAGHPGVDAAEIAKFDALAAGWWDPAGPMAPLHRLNPARLDHVLAQIDVEFGRDRRLPAPLAGLSVLDIGCGAGLMTEPLARLGAEVTGIDLAAEALAAARRHAAAHGLSIDYRVVPAGTLAAEGARFDVVLALEVIEHVPDPAGFAATAAGLLRPGGLLVASTLNRTAASWALGIVAAERVLRWLPRGTHDWRRFLTPDELAGMLAGAGLAVVDRTGLRYRPLRDDFVLDGRDLSVNYLMTARRT